MQINKLNAAYESVPLRLTTFIDVGLCLCNSTRPLNGDFSTHSSVSFN